MGLAKYLRILLLICLACPIFVIEVPFKLLFFLQFKESTKNSRHSYLCWNFIEGVREVREGSLPPVLYCSEDGTQRLFNMFSLLLHISFYSPPVFLTWKICCLALENKTVLGVDSHSSVCLLIAEQGRMVLGFGSSLLSLTANVTSENRQKNHEVICCN